MSDTVQEHTVEVKMRSIVSDFWMGMALQLKDELVRRGDIIDDLTATVARLTQELAEARFESEERNKTIDAMVEDIEEMYAELQRLTTCQLCEGETKVDAFWEMPNVDGAVREYTCPRCNGTGKEPTPQEGE